MGYRAISITHDGQEIFLSFTDGDSNGFNVVGGIAGTAVDGLWTLDSIAITNGPDILSSGQNGGGAGSVGGAGDPAAINIFTNVVATGGTGSGNRTGGGAGGACIGPGGIGGNGVNGTAVFNVLQHTNNYGAGGGGAGSAEHTPLTNVGARRGTDGGHGGSGYIKISLDG